MKLSQHPFLATIAPYMRVERYVREGSKRTPRPRLELTAAAPTSLLQQALALQTECPHCGAVINPFRTRTKGTGRANPRHVYVAVACPLQVSIGCSRGTAAHDETNAIAEALIANGARETAR